MDGRTFGRLAGAATAILTLAGLSTVVAGGAAAHRAATTLTIWCWTGADGPLTVAGSSRLVSPVNLTRVALGLPASIFARSKAMAE